MIKPNGTTQTELGNVALFEEYEKQKAADPDNYQLPDDSPSPVVSAKPVAKTTHQKLQEIRREYHKDNIFIHLCGGCDQIGMMLHEQVCILCGKENDFYDPGLQVDQELGE